MTPAGRLQAAIEIVDEVIRSAIDEGPPADAIVSRYFKNRRYAGSKDRRAVRELAFRAIRRAGERPATGRQAIIGLASEDPSLVELFGQVRGPSALVGGEEGAAASNLPEWLVPELSPLISRDEWQAFLERAPLDLRVNVARVSRAAMQAELPEALPTTLSPWGLRMPAGSRIDDHPAYLQGRIEIQDEGSQLIALACEPRDEDKLVDLCAGAGGKSLALAAAAPGATILATDSNRDRLSKLKPRAERAGAAIETRLLSTPRELQDLEDWQGKADVVLVDAPCSGSGTWRRNPEGRWRLTPQRLDRLTAVQERLLDIAAEVVRPGGRLVYAVCSLLSREGARQIDAFLSRRSSWQIQEMPIGGGRPDGAGRLLTPGHDGTDGFFVARLARPC